MGRHVAFVYGLLVYILFLVTFLYLIGFVSNVLVPKRIDSGSPDTMGSAVLINVLLLGLFAVQHSVMARPAFKAWWTKIVPKPVERSTFVLATNLIFILLYWQWRPITGIVWEVEHPVPRAILLVVCFAGWSMALYSTFLIDHFDLFGLRQVYFYMRGREYTHRKFIQRSLYKYIRHPLMAGFLIAIWAAPTMTQGHLLFALVMTAYIFLGMFLEERDLLRHLGEDYRRYRQRTPMLLPFPKVGARQESEPAPHAGQ